MKKSILFLLIVTFCYQSNASLVVPKKSEEPKSFLDVFKRMDKSILQSKDSSIILEYFKEQATILRKLAETNYKESFGDIDDKKVIRLSMLLAAEEQRELNGTENENVGKKEKGDAFSCLIDAIGIGSGAYSLASSLTKMTMRTIIGVVKTIFSTYFSAFMLAWEVYNFGECMGYW